MASSSRYDIVLGFTADVSQAKTQMAQLQSELQRLSTTEIKTNGISQGITQANNEVLKLSAILKDCFNVDTGKLDINKFLVQTEQYGMSWKDIKANIKSFGAEGEQAWAQLNAQIAQGETGIIQISKLAEKFYDQLKRTAKIQLSYGVLNSFASVFQNAYSYAQDLNESLNNIQIVTGKSNDEMAKFAKNANEAAKALSTTTTSYTDAALIYYQQGLSTEEVEERTNTTIKLANVTGESAEDVSSYMTAIWNNFDDGSQSLEYYADVITKLGASTASSSEEIAEGLGQFSAVANTVGLSYEYATSALATVVAQTRQSADTVGNSFKTIFARLESLNLGETLDDDTTLTKYTEALEKVGVNVQLENGQLQDMDDILDQLGDKWETLNEQQKNGLAYTVAGARQYTNFIALMDNWSKVEENIGLASDSEGTLQEQADIYAESWEAAQKRLKAAWEELYDLIIDDDTFILITNGLSGMVEGVSSLVKSLGGLKGLLPLIISLVTQLFSKQIAQSFTSIATTAQSAYNTFTGKDVKFKNKRVQHALDDIVNTDQTEDSSLAAANENHEKNIIKLNKEQSSLNDVQKKYNNLLTIRNQLLLDEANKFNAVYADEISDLQELSKETENFNDLAEKKAELMELEAKIDSGTIKPRNIKNSNLFSDNEKTTMVGNGKFPTVNIDNSKKIISEKLQKYQKEEVDSAQKIVDLTNKIQTSYANEAKQLKDDIAQKEQIIQINKDTIKQDKEALDAALKNRTAKKAEVDQLKELERTKGLNKDETEKLTKAEKELTEADENVYIAENKLSEDESNLIRRTEILSQDKEKLTIVTKRAGGAMESSADSASKLSNKVTDVSTQINQLTSALSAIISYGSTLSSTADNLKEGTFGLSDAISLLTTGMFAFNAVNNLNNGSIITWITNLVVGNSAVNESTASLFGFTVATKSAEGWTLTFAGTLGAVVLPLIAITAALVGFVYIVKKIEDLSPEKTLERLNEQVSDLKQNAEDAAAAYDDLIDTLESIHELEDSIKSMSSDTEEWTDSVEELNNKYKDLITTYSLIYGTDWAVDEKGKIYLLDGAEDKIKEEAKENENNANLSLAAAEANKTKVQNSIEVKKSADNFENILSDKFTDGIKESIEANLLKNGDKNYQELTTSEQQNAWIEYVEKLIKNNQESGNTEQVEKYSNILAELQNAITEYNDVLYGNATDYADEIFKIIQANDNLSESDYKSVEATLLDKINSDNLENIEVSNKDKQSYAEGAGLIYDSSNGKFYQEDENGEKGDEQQIESTTLKIYAILQELSEASKSDFIPIENEVIETIPEETNEGSDGTADKNIKTYDLDEDLINETAEALYNLNEANGMTLEQAKAITVANEKLNAGYADIIENYEEYTDGILNNNKASSAYIQALESLKKDLSAITDIDTDKLSDSFVTDAENLQLVKEAANGSMEAITELKERAAKDLSKVLDEEGDLSNVEINITAEDGDFYKTLDDILSDSEQWDDLEIGISAKTDKAANELIDFYNQMIEDGKITTDEVNEALDAIGWEPSITWKEVTMDAKDFASYKNRFRVGGTEYENGQAYLDAVGETNVASSTTIKIPVINSANTRWKGNTSSQVSSTNKTNAADNASSGGSSQKDTKNAADEIERYHVIKNQLEDLSNQLDRISSAKDRAFGPAKLKLIDNEIAKYKELLGAQEEYLNQISSNLQADQATLAAYGAVFDSNGTITNYEELMNAQIAKYNASLTDEAEAEYENFTKALELYEESQDLYQEALEQWHEYRQQIYDDELEAIEYKLEFSIEIDDAELKYLEYLLGKLDDAATDAAESIALLGEEIENTTSKVEAYKTELQDLLTEIGKGDSYSALLNGTANMEDIMNSSILADEDFDADRWRQDIIDIYEALIEQQEQYQQLWDDFIDELKDFWDEWEDRLDSITEKYEYLNTVAEKYQDIVSILGQEATGVTDETMIRLAETVTKTAVSKYEAAQQKEAAAKAYQEEAWERVRQGEAEGLDEEYLADLRKIAEEADQTVDEIHSEVLDAQVDAAQAMEDEYKTRIDIIFKAWEDGIAGIQDSLTDLQDAFDKQNNLNELYMETYEQAYNITKLTREIAESIEDSDVIANKQELSNLLDEINEKQASGVRMSEYEYEAYQKEYELLLAKQALEDAQDAKNQVRMRRDSEGNMSYVYTADQDAIDEAQSNYDDAAYNFAELNVGEISEASQQVVQLYNELEEELKNIDESDTERREEVIAYYQEQIEYWEDQMQDAFDWNAELTEQTGYDYWQLADDFSDTVLSEVTGYETIEEMESNFLDYTQNMLNELIAADEDHAADLTQITWDTDEEINDALDDVDDQMDETEEKADEMQEEYTEDLEEMSDAAEEFESNWASTVQDIIAQNDALIASLESLISYYYDVAAAAEYAAAATGAATASSGSTSSSGSGDGGTSGTSVLYKVVTSSGVTLASNLTESDAVAYSNSNNSKIEETVNSQLKNNNGNYSSEISAMYLNRSHIEAMATGGYTGDWGTSDGKLAFLHEKELVLNASDTKNMLSIVDTVRDITDMLSKQAYGANVDLSGVMANVANSATTEQNITINADFPNATDRNEIAEAFNNLLNRTSQYINRKA